MTTVEPFGRPHVSVEKLLVSYLRHATGVHALTELPPEFDEGASALHVLPVIQVQRITGADYNPVLDRPTVDIDCFARTRGEADDLAEQVRYAIRVELPVVQVWEGAVITSTRTVMGPRWLAHANRNVRRYVGSYELSLHPQG